MILSLLALMATQAALTLGALDQMSPQAAGEAALAGHDHAPIVQVVALAPAGMDPPGTFRRLFFERPTLTAGGCIRQRWTATFYQALGEPENDADLHNAFATTEITLSGPAGCPEAGYVHLNPGLEPAQALVALRRLEDLRLGGAKANFRCSDKTGSGLCADPKALRPALAKLSPWAVTLEDGRVAFWMGTPGGVVTEVRYAPTRPERVAVERYFPAPF